MKEYKQIKRAIQIVVLLVVLYIFFYIGWVVYFSQICGPDSEKIILASHKEFVSIKEIDDQFGTKYYVATSTDGTRHTVQAEVTCHLWKAAGLTIMNID